MESKLNDLNLLIDKLTSRINSVKENNTLSILETDIILDLLRQAYLATEQIRLEIINGNKIISSKLEEAVPEIRKELIPEPVKNTNTEDVLPVTESPIELAEVHSENTRIEQTTFDNIPLMSFNKVEVESNEILKEPHASDQEPEVSEIYNVPPQEKAAVIPDITTNKTPVQEVSEMNKRPANETVTRNKPIPGDLFGTPTLADKLKNEIPTVIDKINQGKSDQTLAHKMQLKPIQDLKNAIGINEKFQFVNDLFEGRIELYNDAINRLNSCGSMNNADNIFNSLKSTLGWNENNEAFNKLKSFINRRYL